MGPAVFDQLDEAKRDVELPEYLANSRFHKARPAAAASASAFLTTAGLLPAARLRLKKSPAQCLPLLVVSYVKLTRKASPTPAGLVRGPARLGHLPAGPPGGRGEEAGGQGQGQEGLRHRGRLGGGGGAQGPRQEGRRRQDARRRQAGQHHSAAVLPSRGHLPGAGLQGRLLLRGVRLWWVLLLTGFLPEGSSPSIAGFTGCCLLRACVWHASGLLHGACGAKRAAGPCFDPFAPLPACAWTLPPCRGGAERQCGRRGGPLPRGAQGLPHR